MRAPETDQKVIDIIRTIRQEQPTLGKESVTLLLRSEYGITLSSSTVGRIIKRHKLFFAETASHINKRIEDEPKNSVSFTKPRLVKKEKKISDLDDPFLSLAPGITS